MCHRPKEPTSRTSLFSFFSFSALLLSPHLFFPRSPPLFLLPFYHMAPPPHSISPPFSSLLHLSIPLMVVSHSSGSASRGRDETISLPSLCTHFLRDGSGQRMGRECQALGWELSAAQTKQWATNMTDAAYIAEEY